MKEVTLVLGVSANSGRYANQLVKRLSDSNRGFIPFGRSKGMIEGVEIQNDWNANWNVDTVSLYIRPDFQKEYFERIMALAPRRVIFNPGTENLEFEELLDKAEISHERACSLVLLATGVY